MSTPARMSPRSASEAHTAERHPTGEEIELRAYQIYVERGGADGHDVDDWLQAERELVAKYQRTEPTAKKATV